MIEKTPYTVSKTQYRAALENLPEIDFRLTLNSPTGNIFSDPWEIKKEFRQTVWEEILASLPEPIGEARLIKLSPGVCYSSHSDIDDRWHLTLKGDRAYLIDLDSDLMYSTNEETRWYTIHAGTRHSAANFNWEDRIQLVVRKPLNFVKQSNPTSFRILVNTNVINWRFIFDDKISPWLNYWCKQGNVEHFSWSNNEVSLVTNAAVFEKLRDMLDPDIFTILRV